ncbi:MAG TPA: tRNA preQ1(34) S-adenosylmethionine ribosyltransferase-isomerase QueA [Elusimicrobia bacterium]|nr:tRNA preQ1(34) S-adenosylmethionine ribosyltransferase-isomerase QueA [Elusimicrobiota bacterium]
MARSEDLLLSSYEYTLPKELIAQAPRPEREESRLLVLVKDSGEFFHRKFSDIHEFLNAGDCLVINSTRVIPVRIFARKPTGGRVEVLFMGPFSGSKSRVFRVLLKPFQRPGSKIILPGAIEAAVVGRDEKGGIEISADISDVIAYLDKYGVMPLPPYIKRPKDGSLEDNSEAASSAAALHQTEINADKLRYQTVYAKEAGSIAAPTAGLHFTEALLEKIRAKGVKVVKITLHVGWGTFKPVESDNISAHTMLPEYFEVNTAAINEIKSARHSGNRVVAVGTTSVRTLESLNLLYPSLNLPDGFSSESVNSETSIFIYPGFSFGVVDAMITNFHLPHSSPLIMTSAFAGRDTILRAYADAIKEGYRFYSYGDAMLIF